MLARLFKKKSLVLALCLFSLLGIPVPPAKAVPWLSPKAVIKSCATPSEDQRPVPLAKPRPGPSGTGFLPAPMQQVLTPTTVPPAPMAEAGYAGLDRGEQKKGELDVHQTGKKVDKKIRKAHEIYLSNDDSMSLASAQRLIYAIDNFLPLYRDEIRPHEFLNYFHFQTNSVGENEVFSVNYQMAPREGSQDSESGSKGETLGLAVQGKKMTLAQRRPAVITLVVDKSGSMEAEGKMEYLKEGLATLKGQLKSGDVLNVVEFDHETCNAMEGFVVGRDPWKDYDTTVKELGPRGSTDLHAGLVEGYKLAEKFYNPANINRVLLITDAIANTGQLSTELMASIGKYYDTKKIALSGIGVGLDFNDELLDTLTETGKGAYLFLGMKDAIPRVFGSDFISLLDTVARDVHFQANFPQGMHLDIFYGEEVSTEKEQVQPIHYFANTSQLFLLDMLGHPQEGDKFNLKIEFTDPVSEAGRVEFFPANLAEIRNNGQKNIAKARLVMAFAKLLEETSLPGNRPYQGSYYGRHEPKGKDAKIGREKCTLTLAEMNRQQGIFTDGETKYVTDLAQKYCSRY